MAVKPFYSANEAARLAGLNQQTVRRWAKLGLIPGYELFGKRYVFMREPFDLWLAKYKEQEAA